MAIRTDRPVRSRTFGFCRRGWDRTSPAPEPIPAGRDGRSNGGPPRPQPRVVGVAAAAAAGGDHDIPREGFGGARLLVSDVRLALLLLDEARQRVVERLFGVSRDQLVRDVDRAWKLAQAAHDNSDQMLRGPGGPTRADAGAWSRCARGAARRDPRPSSRETPLVATLLTIAVAGAPVPPALSRTAHGIRTSSHRARLSCNHRYGHLLPARSDRRRGEKE